MRKIVFMGVFALVTSSLFAGTMNMDKSKVTDDIVMKVEWISESEMKSVKIFLRGDEEIARQKIVMESLDGKPNNKIIEMIGKIPDGIVKQYYPSGQLKGEVNYKNNMMDGLARTYYLSGNIEAEVNYKDGEKSSSMKMFYESGALKNESEIINGEVKGNKGYYENGAVKYEMNQDEGTFILYDETGNILPPEKVMDTSFMKNFLD